MTTRLSLRPSSWLKKRPDFRSNAHRPEVLGRRRPLQRDGVGLARGERRASLDDEEVAPVARERRTTHETGRFDTGKGLTAGRSSDPRTPDVWLRQGSSRPAAKRRRSGHCADRIPDRCLARDRRRASADRRTRGGSRRARTPRSPASRAFAVRPGRNVLPVPVSLIAPRTLLRIVCSAGARPKRSAVTRLTPTENATMRPSRAKLAHARDLIAGGRHEQVQRPSAQHEPRETAERSQHEVFDE